MYNWVLIVMLATGPKPVAVFEKQYDAEYKCRIASDIINMYESIDLDTVCVPVYKTDGGAWRRAQEVYDRT